MLRIHVEETENPATVTLRMEGKLIQPWVHELGKTWLGLIRRFPWPSAIRADLNAVSYVDEAGMAMLTSFYLAGCELVGSGLFITAAIDECTTIRSRHVGRTSASAAPAHIC